MLFRQPVMWYGVLVSIVASAFFVFNISAAGNAAIIRDMIVVIFTMMAGVSTGQFAGLAVSLDGEGLWLMKSAPIAPSTYYSAKLAFATAPGAVVLVLLFAGLSFVTSVPQHPLYVSVPVGLAVLSVICALSVMSDAIKPNFSVRLSATGNQKQKDPGKALLVTFGSQIGSAALGAIFAFPTYYSRIRCDCTGCEPRALGCSGGRGARDRGAGVDQADPALIQRRARLIGALSGILESWFIG